jgi:hypothetical protein
MRSNGIDRTHLEGNAVVLGAPRLPAGPRVPVPSGLSRRHGGPAHDRGNSAAYSLPNFHEKANPPRSWRVPRAGAAHQPAHVSHGHHAGQGSVSPRTYLAELPSLIEEITAGTIAVRANAVPLADVENAWERNETPGERTVLVP